MMSEPFVACERARVVPDEAINVSAPTLIVDRSGSQRHALKEGRGDVATEQEVVLFHSRPNDRPRNLLTS